MTPETTNGEANYSSTDIRVLYADTDKMSVVYHATYLRWFEAGRAKYMRRRGSNYAKVEKSGIQLPVVEANLTYHLPARYDDVLSVKAWIEDIGRLQIKYRYEITRGDDILVRGFTRHASINTDGKLTRIPKHIRDSLMTEEKDIGVEVD